jgi:16S rRNA (guanine527-N7)-methyltransferase
LAFLEKLERLVPSASRLLDLGSGGGVPGLLLAAWLPASTWTLVDVHRRRTSFLARTVALPPWDGRVAVVRAAAEDLAHDASHRSSYDIVVSRSFGSPALTAECAAGFLRPGGRLLVAEPPTPDAARWPEAGLRTLGLAVEDAGGSVAVFVQRAEVPPFVPRSWRELARRAGG